MERPVVRDKRPGTILSSAEKIETSVLVFVNFCTDIHNRHGRIKFSGLRCDQIGPDLRELTRNQTRIPAHINEACARPPSCIVRARVCLPDSHRGRENSDKSATVTRPVYYSSRMTFCAESFYGMKLFYVDAGRGYSFARNVSKLFRYRYPNILTLAFSRTGKSSSSSSWLSILLQAPSPIAGANIATIYPVGSVIEEFLGNLFFARKSFCPLVDTEEGVKGGGEEGEGGRKGVRRGGR